MSVKITFKTRCRSTTKKLKISLVSILKKFLKLRALVLCVLSIIAYVSFNNYFILSLYISSTNHRIKNINTDPVIRKASKFELIYIDEEDLEVAKLKLNNSIRYKILTKDFFDVPKPDEWLKSRKIFEKLSKNEEAIRKCIHPKLNPFESEIQKFVIKEPNLSCNPRENWVHVEKGEIRISKNAIKQHGNIVCAYIPLYRGHDDFSVYEGSRIFPIIDHMPLISDFFKVDCRSKKGAIYSNIHSGIAYESTIHHRTRWNPISPKALGYDFLMIGFDSVSRMSWIRLLPKTYEFIVKELGSVILKGYNVVGDGTPQALLPILTGKRETELPEARRGYENASYVDKFPWIWKRFKENGYATQWAEDMQAIGTFQMRMLGFKNQPVDHYMRPFYLEAEKYFFRFKRLCIGSLSRHQNMFNWLKEFWLMYKKQLKFSFIFHSEASHNYNNPLSLVDDDFVKFLRMFKENGFLDNTVLILMSDHGARISDLRQYSQGKLEERMPFFSIRMPPKFQENYPTEMHNLRLNSHRLTTPFDIHETLKSLLNFDLNARYGSDAYNSKPRRGISLFEYISPSRTCEDAEIEAHWCACLSWTSINITSNYSSQSEHNYKSLISDKNLIFDKNESSISSYLNYMSYYMYMEEAFNRYNYEVLKLALKAIEFINSLINDVQLSAYCEIVRLKEIEKLSKLDVNKRVLSFKNSKDMHGREALFDSDEEIDENDFLSLRNSSNSTFSKGTIKNIDITYQIVLTTLPGNATYELSFKFNRNKNLFKFNKNEISRINSYNGTSNCIVDIRPDLRQFCYCKKR